MGNISISNYKKVKLPSVFSKINWHVGSPFTPTSRSVQKLVQFWKIPLIKTRNEPASDEQMRKVNFWMTGYTAFLVSFTLGYRAVHEPIPLLEEIDSSGFAVISDKDSDDRYNSRLVWLHPVCAKQLEYYWEHIANIRARLEMLEPKLQSRNIESRRGRSVDSIVFLSGKSGLVDVSEKTLLLKSKDIFPLPYNSSRHYLRTNLLLSGCPEEIINAFMGHWERGEEPWSIHSGLSPVTYKNVLQKHLGPIIERDGWEAIPGWEL